jgi:hypothetical protein
VQWRKRVIVVQFKAMDEAGVEHRRRWGAGSPAAPPDQRAGADVVRAVIPSTP